MSSKFDYKRYLASREWALKKKAIRERSGGICERCLNRPHQQTHHLTYENLGNEPLEDLLGVCGACHEYLSAESDFDPAEHRPEKSPRHLIDNVNIFPGIAETIHMQGMGLPMDPKAFAEWNAEVQYLIENIDENPGLVMRLAQIKLDVNKRLYAALRGHP